MKPLILIHFSLVLLFIVFSCKEEQVTEPWAGKNAFDPPQLEMWFDKDTVFMDDTLTIFLRCQPVFTGKGRTVIGKRFIQPVSPNGFMEDSNYYYSLIAFNKDIPSLTEWKIKIESPYGFTAPLTTAFVFIDSVYSLDGLQLYHIRSEEAERIYGKIGGTGAGAYPLPSITYRP